MSLSLKASGEGDPQREKDTRGEREAWETQSLDMQMLRISREAVPRVVVVVVCLPLQRPVCRLLFSMSAATAAATGVGNKQASRGSRAKPRFPLPSLSFVVQRLASSCNASAAAVAAVKARGALHLSDTDFFFFSRFRLRLLRQQPSLAGTRHRAIDFSFSQERRTLVPRSADACC